jgi:hypothetical protein
MISQLEVGSYIFAASSRHLHPNSSGYVAGMKIRAPLAQNKSTARNRGAFLSRFHN